MRSVMGAVVMGAALWASGVVAQEQEFVAGDGTRFSLPMEGGVPTRASTDEATFEASGFDIDTRGAPSLTDRFTLLFKGGEQPVRVRVEDITLGEPVLLIEAAVPEELPSAGFRRSRFEMRAATCPIARGEPCSAWMFGPQAYRLYRVTLTYAGEGPVVLLQAEPYQMGAFITRLGDRIPNASATQP
jgi:hypothetical protein